MCMATTFTIGNSPAYGVGLRELIGNQGRPCSAGNQNQVLAHEARNITCDGLFALSTEFVGEGGIEIIQKGACCAWN